MLYKYNENNNKQFNMNAEQLAHLLKLLHANTLTEDSYNPMLDELRRVTNSGVALLIENKRDTFEFSGLSISDEENDTVKIMNAYAHIVTQVPYFNYLQRCPHGQPVRLNTAVYKDIQSGPMADYYQAVGVRFVCGAFIETSQSNIALGINRPLKQGDYDHEDDNLIRVIIPHIKVAAENRHRLNFLQNRMENIAQALELSGQAIGIISANGELLHCSMPFGDCLVKNNLMVSGMGRFKLRIHRHHDWLEQTIKKVSHYQNHQPQTLRLSIEPLIYIHLTMLNQLNSEPLFLLNLKTAATIPQWWQLVYSFTPKELLLIDKLLSGLTLPEAADQLQVSHNTVRTHLHNIQTKVHCSSQNQLLVTLLSTH